MQLALEGLMNYLHDEDHESVRLAYSGFSLADYHISEAKFMPNRISEGVGSVRTDVDLKGDHIAGKVHFSGTQLRFDVDSKQKPQNQFEEIMYSIVDQISTIEFDATISGPADDLKFAIDSNLDNLLAEKMKNIVGERVKQTRQEIEKKVNEQIAPYRQQLTELTEEKEKWLRAQVAGYEAMIDKETERAEAKKKEVEQAYAKEKSKLEKKVKDLLKF